MKLQLIRHATLWIEYAGVKFLVDPMLSDKGVNPPIVNSANEKRNPLVPLPFDIKDKLQPDAVIVSHLHRDHWDEAAMELLPKSLPILCQTGDEEIIQSVGFESVSPIEERITFSGVTIYRTSGQHGTGEIGEKMGKVSGFVLKANGEPTLYIAGDTIWCDDVKHAIESHKPDITVVNAGGARFLMGDPITMDEYDIVNVCNYAPTMKVIAVHMDSINHCLVTRAELASRLEKEGFIKRVLIPADGEWI